MNSTTKNARSETYTVKLPLALQLSAVLIFVGSAMLAARVIWEQTVWTWERGPQMVGFSLAHGPGGILFLFPFLLCLWIILAIALTLIRKFKKKGSKIAPTTWAALVLAISLLVL